MSWIFFIVGTILFCLGAGGIQQLRTTPPAGTPPAGEAHITWKGVRYLFLCGLLSCWAGYCSLPLSEEELAAREAEAAKCRASSLCWGRKHLREAAWRCGPRIEGMAKYDFKWTDDGRPENRFSDSLFFWKDQDKGHLKYVGERLQFQNGFGAFQKVMYRCDYDPDTDQVLGVKILPAGADVWEVN